MESNFDDFDLDYESAKLIRLVVEICGVSEEEARQFILDSNEPIERRKFYKSDEFTKQYHSVDLGPEEDQKLKRKEFLEGIRRIPESLSELPSADQFELHGLKRIYLNKKSHSQS